MIRLGLFILLIIFLSSALSTNKKNSIDLVLKNSSDSSFSHLLTKFQKSNLPYETGKIKTTQLSYLDSAFIKNAVQSKNLVLVTDPTANVWDDADDEGKINFSFPDLIGAGAFIKINTDILLLEIIDMYELKGESESNKQGVFKRTTYLCTFTKEGRLINFAVANFSLTNEHGSLSRWRCIINSSNEIMIKEYGSRIEQKDNYEFITTLKIASDGKIVKIKSAKR